MSSFICSSKQFNSIQKATIDLIQSGCSRRNNSINIYPFDFIEEFSQGFTFAAINKIKSMVDIMRELNVVCVSLQYRHQYEGKLDNEIAEQLTIVKTGNECETLNKYGLYKSLQCLNYQIELEHLTSIRELTEQEKEAIKFFEILKREIAFSIVDNSPEYNNCSWSID